MAVSFVCFVCLCSHSYTQITVHTHTPHAHTHTYHTLTRAHALLIRCTEVLLSTLTAENVPLLFRELIETAKVFLLAFFVCLVFRFCLAFAVVFCFVFVIGLLCVCCSKKENKNGKKFNRKGN